VYLHTVRTKIILGVEFYKSLPIKYALDVSDLIFRVHWCQIFKFSNLGPFHIIRVLFEIFTDKPAIDDRQFMIVFGVIIAVNVCKQHA